MTEDLWAEFRNRAKEPKKAIHLAWFAGLFDGEGCVTIKPVHSKEYRRTSYQLGIQIAMTHAETVKRVSEFWGRGNLRTQEQGGFGTKQVWVWRAQADDALAILEECLPYLFTKKAEAEVGITFQKRKQEIRRMWSLAHIPDAELAALSRLRDKLREARA